MTRFTWLQSRTQTLIVAGALAAVAIVAAITGVRLSDLYASLIKHCTTGCDLATNHFLSHDHFLQNALTLLVRVVPALIGIFWGAPLIARELETGTYKLAWTQSVTRSRWLTTKFLTGALASAFVAGALTLTVTWWFRAIDKVDANQYSVLDARDIAPIGYALFAFAFGALAGAVIRRTLPAMATTLGVFVFARIAINQWVRPHLLAARHLVTSLLSAGGFGFTASNGGPIDLEARVGNLPNAWTLSSHIVTNAGQPTTAAMRAAFVQQHCPAIAQPPSAPGGGVKAGADLSSFDACRQQAAHVFKVAISYQPAGRYWAFQWLETGIFVALAVAALGACYWWLTRRTM